MIIGTSLLIVTSVFIVLAIVQGALAALQVWEHRRFARSRLGRLPSLHPIGRAMLFVPCKGLDIGLKENLRSLFRGQNFVSLNTRNAHTSLPRLKEHFSEVQTSTSQ